MKKYMRVCVLTLALLALMALPAFAGFTNEKVTNIDENATIGLTDNNDYLTSVEYKTTVTGQYLLVVLEGDDVVPNEENILYVDQATGDGTKVVFNKVYPSSAQKSTVCLAGPELASPIKLANLDVNGVTVSGQVKSFDPKKATTIELKQDGVVKYTGQIDALAEGSGQKTQSFSIESVAAGTYDLVVSKKGHLPFTITGVVVDGAVDLTGNSNAAIKLITLLCGDITGDKKINNSDLFQLQNNFLKTGANVLNPDADITGDAKINNSDLFQVQNNFLKTDKNCVANY